MKKPEKQVMICAPADAQMMVPGSVFDKICVRCARGVMMAPTGARYFETHCGIEVICLDCYDPRGRDRNAARRMRLTADLDTIRGELMNVTVNHRSRSTN